MRLRAQHGFTTVTLMGALLVGGAMVAAGFAAVDPDIGISRADQDTKQAYGAAESGLQWYLNRLGQENGFYLRCDQAPAPNSSEQAPVSQRWNRSGTDIRKWRKLPGESAEYAVELVPAPPYSQCVTGNQYSMIDSEGNLKLRISGRSRSETRTVLATLRRRSFIDFIYFTHFETSDPATYADPVEAERQCARFRNQRSPTYCTEIQFPSADVVRGPLHTNDSIMVCNAPTFGRDRRDMIELNGASPGYVASPGCSAKPKFQGTRVYPAGQLAMPDSNTELAAIAAPEYRFKGHTAIVFNGEWMTVTNDGKTTTLPLPPNGVIHVGNVSCQTGFQRRQTYASVPAGCGDAWVRGSYARNLSIAADNDVVINGNLTRASDGLLLGLVANNFVRVYHPVSFGSGSSCTNKSTALTNPVVHAAILALQHSFIVDNWYCGDDLGTLTVNGAIAQRYRGPVGMTSSGTVVNGYRKTYEYNDRLRYREPPYFLDPVQASWRIARETEQADAVD